MKRYCQQLIFNGLSTKQFLSKRIFLLTFEQGCHVCWITGTVHIYGREAGSYLKIMISDTSTSAGIIFKRPRFIRLLNNLAYKI